GGRGFNALDGGSGDDTLSYAGLTIGVTLDLATGVATSAGRDRLVSIEHVYGSRWADTLRGDGGANTLFGADGDDSIEGRDGDDVLAGGAGSDVLTGGAGADRFVFGRGDGADRITDLSAGDTLVIHQYASWRELVQVGADTRVVLSDTDSILLTGISVADASGRISFNAQPRPDYALPAEAPEVMGGGPLRIDSRYYVYEGEALNFDGTIGAVNVYADVDDADPGLTNAGHITVIGAGLGANGVGLNGVGISTEFHNLATGTLEVITTASNGRATGVNSNGWQGKVINEGLIDVRSAATAFGLDGSNVGMSLINSGTLRVAGVGNVFGANLGLYGDLDNTGTIDVRGSGQVTGVYSFQNSTIVNDGLIRVANSTGVGVGISVNASVIRITNSGR
ncbi:MAG: hypothetical protein EON96_17785, partial [Caulobacteraceae bacterium]